jgi:restriction endonuclease S subunit
MKVHITEIADINIGYQFRAKIEPTDDGTHSVIQIRDFDDNRNLNTEGLLRVKIDKPIEQFHINKGDILFLSRGHRNWAATIAEDLKDAIAVSHFFVIKIKSTDILPEYLAWYINQAPAQEYLHINARHGTHMPLIPMSAFKGLSVEVPSQETQKKIVELSRLMEKEKQLLTELHEKRSRLINTVCLKAAKGKKEKAK